MTEREIEQAEEAFWARWRMRYVPWLVIVAVLFVLSGVAMFVAEITRFCR